MHLHRRLWLCCVAVALTFGCDDGGAPMDARPDAATRDGGRDSDAGTPADAGTDRDASRPDAPSVTGATPGSVARGARLTVSGARLDGATSVRIGDVEQAFAPGDATSLAVAMLDASTPLGEQPLIVTTDRGQSPAFTITVLDPLAVSGASAPDETTVVVGFNRDLDVASVSAADFTVEGLTVDAAEVSGATVTLTTSAQTAGADYVVSASAIDDTFGNPLGPTRTAVFSGYRPGAPAITGVSPAQVIRGFSSLSIHGRSLTGASVTVGAVAQTVTSSSATELVTDVDPATPVGTQPVVVTTSGGSSSAFAIDVLDAFRITAAVATSATAVEVTFNRAVMSPVAPGDFSIPGLGVSGASASGSVVTLTTTAHTPDAPYTVGAGPTVVDAWGSPATADTATFTGFVPPPPPSFVVVRVGDGSAPLDSSAAAVFLERREIATGAVGSTLAMPTSASGASHAFTLAGSGFADGSLSLSEDGRLLALQGFQSVPGTPSVQSVSDPRVVAVVDAADFGSAPTVDTTTTLGTLFATTAPRGAVIDGTTLWVVGGFGAVHTIPLGGSTPTRVSASSTAEPSSGRAIAIFDGQLYYASGGGSPAQLNALGSGLPTSGGTTSTVVYTTSSPYSFTGLDRDPSEPGVDVFYQANDGAGIQRFVKRGGTWTLEATFGPAVRHVTCFEEGADVVCLATTADTLYTFRDVGGMRTTGSATVLATASPNTAFRGIALAPSP